MSGMNDYLANYFGTKTASAQTEEQQQEAQVEFFSKLAAENNIDLSQLSEGQIQELWDGVFKGASEEEKDEEKKEEAKKELEEKKAAAEKFAEAEYMGKIMAHSYVAELNKIAGHTGGTTTDMVRVPNAVENSRAGNNVPGQSAARNALNTIKNKVKENPRAAKALGIGAGVAALGGAAYAAHSRKKESSALDQLGAENAVKMAMAAGFDGDVAAERVGAVFTLGLGESEKIAASALHLSDAQAIEIRSLEFLEAAGYPVTWNS